MLASATLVLTGVLFGCSHSGTPGASAGSLASAASDGTLAADAYSQRPCAILAAATPCVAAYSTVRTLRINYSGPLYQVTRKSDSTSRDIGLLSDGYANAAAQDNFCSGTSCTITKIYDQTTNGNDLTVAPPGGAAKGAGPNGYDLPANASALPIMAGGHKVYGIYIMPGMGYRNDNTTGIATNGQPEGVYMVTSTAKLDGKCCFDFGNAETNDKDDGAARMDAISMGCPSSSSPCQNRVGIDMENGIYGASDVPAGTEFVTAMGANDGQHTFTTWQGNAQSGSLTTIGQTPLPNGYSPMKQQGAIILGIGGDNSNWDAGYFFEGVMTTGTPTNAVMNSVQANIVSVGYSGS